MLFMDTHIPRLAPAIHVSHLEFESVQFNIFFTVFLCLLYSEVIGGV